MKKLILIPTTLMTTSLPLISLASCGDEYDIILNEDDYSVQENYHLHSKVLKLKKDKTYSFKIDFALWNIQWAPDYMDFQTPDFVRAYISYSLDELFVEKEKIQPSDETWYSSAGFIGFNKQFIQQIVANKSIMTGKITVKQNATDCILTIFYLYV